ncbi:1-phosphofructokinase family hexose kinase [Streptomyces griseocarneus]|uniref:1-phosphofructokinase family hexose kinase n=1 Tax=Streptomyces griseocarneus TaxID=51201 RepID=UPI00167EC13F|nr:1-phosphofructokinase family hexose kinase [Streptomyces griseocarneus]MBZ6473766.1 1-phosphofructokinase family hexose kinase [Streptomyces griseocarneus]GHG64990.1 sugar kinase [Streptomyces griseocarneus]
MILTVTLNAALDLTYRLPRLRPHAEHRVPPAVERPGGKGLNVARVLASLGHETVATGFAGGATGDTVRALLAETSVTDEFVRITGPTRRTVAVVDDEPAGDATQLNEIGPDVTPAEWAAFDDRYAHLLRDARAVALCGSLPPGVPVGAYAHLVRAARARRVPVLLDTSGEPLRRGIAARPDVVKPNAAELAALTGATDPLRAAVAARRRGAHAVAASLGPDGMLALTPDGAWHATPPKPLPGNPTGAGDSAVAGLLSGWVEGLAWPERLARAVALSAATVAAPAAGEYDAAVYEKLLGQVRVDQL